MTLKEHLINHTDEVLARLLIKEITETIKEDYCDEVEYVKDAYEYEKTYYQTTNGEFFDKKEEAVKRQIEILNTEYEIWSLKNEDKKRT